MTTNTWDPDPLTVEAYTCGDCYLLALALHDLTGWPLIVGAYSDENVKNWPERQGQRNQDGHVAVLHPSGKLLDVEGLADDVPENWKCYGVDLGRHIDRADFMIEEWGGMAGTYQSDDMIGPYELAQELIEHFA